VRRAHLEADRHRLGRADVAPAEHGEALGVELVRQLVAHDVARVVELRPAREHPRQLERKHVHHARLREAERRHRRAVELTRADLLDHQLLVAGLAVPREVERDLAARVARDGVCPGPELAPPRRLPGRQRADLDGRGRLRAAAQQHRARQHQPPHPRPPRHGRTS
jgi:hypothetical protein